MDLLSTHYYTKFVIQKHTSFWSHTGLALKSACDSKRTQNGTLCGSLRSLVALDGFCPNPKAKAKRVGMCCRTVL